MRREDLVVAVLCLATAAVVLLDCAHRYFDDRGSIGTGAYPTYVALLLAGCGLSILLQWFRSNRDTEAPPFLPSGIGGRRLAFSAGSLVVYRVATDILGFGIASFLLMVFQMRTLGRHRWLTILGISIAFVLAVSYTFREWLYMALPRGILDL